MRLYLAGAKGIMNKLFIRVGALLAHVLLNVVLVTYATNYDITGSWLLTALFSLFLFLLLTLFIWHLLSFIKFIKTNTK